MSPTTDLFAAPPGAATLSEGEVPLIDHRAMSDWCDDLDTADVCSLLARVPDESRKCLADIKVAAREGNLVAARRAAHRLKGMASNLGAARLARVARNIELGCATADDVGTRVAMLDTTLRETLEALEAHVQKLA